MHKRLETQVGSLGVGQLVLATGQASVRNSSHQHSSTIKSSCTCKRSRRSGKDWDGSTLLTCSIFTKRTCSYESAQDTQNMPIGR
eukprot:4462456-Amphidinium_carterae.1